MNGTDIKVGGATLFGWVSNLTNINEILTVILTGLSVIYVAVRLAKELKNKNEKN